jgi:N6-L-threonylcarbamoyladenine synthase
MANHFSRVLAIETSCDDTSVAIIDGQGQVLSLCSANQDLVHAPFGGVVPEVASRNHTIIILPLIEAALAQAQMQASDVDGLAVTSRPGLIGSLLVGVVTAKALALSWQIPFVGVNHLEGHIHAPFLRDTSYAPPEDFTYPFVALTISGGHTALYEVPEFGRYILLGQTIDDAAGEAFDKFAKMMGLSYPGGVHVDQTARSGRTTAYAFPRPLLHEDNFDFSFSGLKTAAMRQLSSLTPSEKESRAADLCASYQEAIVDVLLAKLDRVVKQKQLTRVILTGGVSANSRLRERAQSWAASCGVQLVIPPLRYCTDNAAMIAYAGLRHLQRGDRDNQTLGPSPRPLPGDFVSEDANVRTHTT